MTVYCTSSHINHRSRKSFSKFNSVAAGSPRERRPEVPMREIPMGQHIKKKKKKKQLKLTGRFKTRSALLQSTCWTKYALRRIVPLSDVEEKPHFILKQCHPYQTLIWHTLKKILLFYIFICTKHSFGIKKKKFFGYIFWSKEHIGMKHA